MPVEYGDDAIQTMEYKSAIEQLAKREPMTEATKNIPRFTGFRVSNTAKGAEYVLTDSEKDRVELIARKVGGLSKIAVEDLRDPQADVMAAKRKEAASSLAVNLDNSCLTVTGAANGTTIKFNSVYREIRTSPTADTFDDFLGYTADDNYLSITRANFKAAGVDKGYDTLSDLLERVETGRFFDPANTVVLASPAFMGLMRKMKNEAGDPLLVPVGKNPLGQPDYQVFGYPAVFSHGLTTTAVDAGEFGDLTGNPVMIIANRNHLHLGRRALSPHIPADTFGWAVQGPQEGTGFFSDELFMKAAYRRAFVLSTRFAAAVLEVTG